MAFAYMLRCSDSSFYVGSARASLDARVADHNAGRYGGYTASRLPVKLVWFQEFSSITDAVAAERRIKGWTRAKKEALIEGDFGRVKQLARRRLKRSSSFETAAARPPQDEDRGSAKAVSRCSSRRLLGGLTHPEEVPSGTVSKDEADGSE